MQNLVEQYRSEHDAPAPEIAAMFIGDKSLLLAPDKERPPREFREYRPSLGKGFDRKFDKKHEKKTARPGLAVTGLR